MSTTDVNTFLPEADSDKSVELCVNFVQLICEFGRVKEITGRELNMVDVSDFEGVDTKACESMSCLVILVEKIKQSLEGLNTSENISAEKLLARVLPTMTTVILILTGEHHGDFMWTSTDSTKLSFTLTKALLTLCKCGSLDQMFCLERKMKQDLCR